MPLLLLRGPLGPAVGPGLQLVDEVCAKHDELVPELEEALLAEVYVTHDEPAVLHALNEGYVSRYEAAPAVDIVVFG